MCITYYWQEMHSNNTNANSVNEAFCFDLVLPDHLKAAFKMVELSLKNKSLYSFITVRVKCILIESLKSLKPASPSVIALLCLIYLTWCHLWHHFGFHEQQLQLQKIRLLNQIFWHTKLLNSCTQTDETLQNIDVHILFSSLPHWVNL